MTKHATGTCDTKDWAETTVSEIDGGGKLTHVSCINTFHGDIDGKAKTEYVLLYRSDGSGSYVGLEHVIGQIAGRYAPNGFHFSTFTAYDRARAPL